MIFPVPEGRVSVGFDQMRPLSAPPEQRTHPHGALDIAARTGERIIAPEGGMLHYWLAFRPDKTRRISELNHVVFPFHFQGHNYFYDIYGGVIILLGKSGMTHFFCHSFANQLYNLSGHRMRWKYAESRETERFPVFVWYTVNGFGHHVREGEKIGDVGNAGFSTGPHVHYEMHKGRMWNPHADRPRPENYYDLTQHQ